VADPGVVHARHPPNKPIARDLLEGSRFLRHDRVLVGLLGFSAIANPFAQWITLLFIVDAVRRLHLSTGQVGLVLAIGAVGTLLGAATAPAVARRLGALRTIVITRLWIPSSCRPPGRGARVGVSVLITALGAASQSTGTPSAWTPSSSRPFAKPARPTVCAAGQRCNPHGLLRNDRPRRRDRRSRRPTVRRPIGLLIGCLGALSTVAWVTGWATLLARGGERLDGAPKHRFTRDTPTEANVAPSP